MSILLERALHRLHEARFNHSVRAIRATAPVRPCDDGVILFTMVGTRVLVPYLIAAKSLHARLGRGRFVVLDDGTLTADDKATLAWHLGEPEIRSIRAVDTGGCPRGGCWERLLLLLELRREAYVIQFDSDTVALGDLDDVRAAIDAGRCFTLRGEDGAEFQTVAALPDDSAHLAPGAHIQQAIEASLARFGREVPGLTRYVRGCAGFAGFAPGGEGRALADAFCAAAGAALGAARLAQWGSEQVMSSLIVANSPDPLLLRYDRYLNYWNEGVPADAALVHFLGTYRFAGGAYLAAARKVIAQLQGAELSRAA